MTDGIIFVGAHRDDELGDPNRGSVYVFEQDIHGQWVQTGKLLAHEGHA